MKNLPAILMLVSTAPYLAGCDANNFDTPPCDDFSYGFCWEPPEPEETGFVPLPVTYTTHPERPFNAYPSDAVILDVSESDGLFVAEHTLDGYRYDRIPIANGAFRFAHGGGLDGTFCPTDGYIISGSFVSQEEIRGYYRYVPSCRPTPAVDFIARCRLDETGQCE